MAIGQLLSLALLSVSLVYSLQNFFSRMDSANSIYATIPPQHLSSSLREQNYTTESVPPSSTEDEARYHQPFHNSGYTPTIAPIIPGVNFPIEYVGEFWVVTFFVIVVHEFGHAAAASLERLQIQGCGTFFLFLFPGTVVCWDQFIVFNFQLFSTCTCMQVHM